MNLRSFSFPCFRSIAILGAAALAQLSASSPAPSDPIEGNWYGMAGFPEDREEIGFEFAFNEKHELLPKIYQPVINLYGVAQPGALKRDGNKYTSKELAFALTLENGKLEGTFSGIKIPISLTRRDAMPVDPPVPALPAGPGPTWRVKLGGSIYAPVAARDGVAYVGTTSGVFQAVRVADGEIAWTFNAGRPIHGEALTTDAHVYVVCDSGFLEKLDRKTGKEVWRYDLGDAQTARVLPHPAVFEYDTRAPRPTLADGVIYVGSGDGALHAMSDDTGERVWRFATKDKVRRDALVDGERVVFGSLDHCIYAVDRKTGAQTWKRDTFAPVTSAPALIGGKLVIGTRGSMLYGFKPESGETAWRAPFWGSWVESDAVERDGLLYIGSSDLRRVSAMDPKDGRVVWRTDVYGWPWGRPLVTDARVYASVGGTSPYMIRHFGSFTALDRKTGKIAWRWTMPEWPGSLMNGFVGGPALDGKTVVVGGLDGTLYAFPAE